MITCLLLVNNLLYQTVFVYKKHVVMTAARDLDDLVFLFEYT